MWYKFRSRTIEQFILQTKLSFCSYIFIFIYINFKFIFQLSWIKLFLFFHEKLVFIFFNEIFQSNFTESNLFTDTLKIPYCSEIFMFRAILFTKSNLLLIPIKHLTVLTFPVQSNFTKNHYILKVCYNQYIYVPMP